MAIVSISLPDQVAKKIDAEKKKQGFSTRSEYIRSLIREHFGEEKVVYLSKTATKRYDKITKDIESGKEKVYTANNVDELMKQLHTKIDDD